MPDAEILRTLVTVLHGLKSGCQQGQKMVSIGSGLRAVADLARAILIRLWGFLNSNLGVAVVSGMLLFFITQAYAKRDAQTKEFETRRERLSLALVEFQQRAEALRQAQTAWRFKCHYREASKLEWAVLTGSGDYIPSSPAYKGIHINAVISEIENATGASSPKALSVLTMGGLNTPPPGTALRVYELRRFFVTYGMARLQFLNDDILPLKKGEKLDRPIAELLGVAEDQSEKLRTMSDQAHEDAQQLETKLQLLGDLKAKAIKDPACPEVGTWPGSDSGRAAN